MFSGGLPPRGAAAAGANSARDVQIAAADAREERQRAQQEADRQRVEAHQQAQAVQAANDQLDQTKQSYKGKEDELNTSWQQIANQFDKARFDQWMFDIKFAGGIMLAITQIICDQSTFAGSALVMFHKACMKMGAAIIGVNSPGAVEFVHSRSFDPTTVLNQIGTNTAPAEFADVRSRTKDHGLQRDSHARRKSSDINFANQKIAEAGKRAADAANKQGEADRTLADAKAAEAQRKEGAGSAPAGTGTSRRRRAPTPPAGGGAGAPQGPSAPQPPPPPRPPHRRGA